MDKIIISCSRRTDIPAFYSQWFINRIRKGFCLVPNPMNSKMVFKIHMRPDTVSVIVFWSKNPEPLLKYIDELDQREFKYYFQFTLNDYPPVFEPHLPPIEKRIETFQKLSEKIGKEKVIWRYDPIIISSETGAEYHIDRFSKIAKELKECTKRCVISIVDLYDKTRRRMEHLGPDIRTEWEPLKSTDMEKILSFIVDTVKDNGMEILSCAEGKTDILNKYNIQPGKCIDDEYINKVFDVNLKGNKDKGQRKLCGCIASRDIGMNNTCGHGCVYCYSTADPRRADRLLKEHNPDSEVLSGTISPDAVPKDVPDSKNDKKSIYEANMTLPLE